MRRRVAWCRGLLVDAYRIPAALVLWNLRKTIYRRRGDWTRCPCQSPSDSGRALETHCDAALDWNEPGRFRLVCPALRTTPRGFCCSLAAPDVRPFWGRAALLFFLVIVGAYAAGVTLGYGTMRAFGSRNVAWLDFLWPRRWENVAKARSQQFSAEAIVALERRDFGLARISLKSALAADPQNYDAALLLAMLDSFAANAHVADAAFDWLMRRHPAHAGRSAVIFHDLLLAKGRPDRLARFALWMAAGGTADSPLWTRAPRRPAPRQRRPRLRPHPRRRAPKAPAARAHPRRRRDTPPAGPPPSALTPAAMSPRFRPRASTPSTSPCRSPCPRCSATSPSLAKRSTPCSPACAPPW